MVNIVDEKRVLRDTIKEEAISRLEGNTGWIHLKDHMNQRIKGYMNELKTVKADNVAKIAALQAKIQVLEEISRKPDIYKTKT